MRLRVFLLLAFGIALPLHGLTGQTRPRPVVNGGYPAVSPDGSRIAFLSDRDGATDLYVISVDGTGEARLTKTAETEGRPDWSANGEEIRFAVFTDDTSRVYSIEPDGQNRTLLGSVPGRAATLSPDGRRVLYSTGSWTAVSLFVSELDGSKAKPLSDGSGVVWNARWSPDGKQIAFTGRDSKDVLHVSVMSADGSNRRQVTHFPLSDGQAQVPSWSPDGRRLAVQAGAKGQPGHIWVVDVATGAARKLAAHDEPYVDEVPVWFPDGRRIAFQSDRTGRMEVWIMNADGSGARQLTK